ncbi:hypothetical protein ACLB2K_044269 [Fragaria x ananassa]
MGYGDRKSQSVRKLFGSYVQSFFASHLVVFVIGLSIGVVITLYCKDFMFNLQITSNSISWITLPQSTPLPLPPQPSPSPVPLPLLDSDHVVTSNVEAQTSPLVHNLDDDLELFWRASVVPRITEFPHNRVPKVAFMFLTKGPIPLAPLWELFFKDHQGLYTIYVHTHPSYVDSWPEDSAFYRTRIPSKKVEWGKPTMIDAERRLLASALLDFSNERFVLLSESCIPLFNFTTIYNFLMNSNQSFLSIYDDPTKVGRGRYNPQMDPSITLSDWRKGSQWFEVSRKLAIEVVSDTKYYPLFRDYCSPPCYMDEHYIPTLVNIIGPDHNSNRTITWVDWSRAGSAHPRTFGRRGVTAEVLNRIRFGTNGTCDAYGNTISSMCFLFARKFKPDTLQPLLHFASMLLGSNSQ